MRIVNCYEVSHKRPKTTVVSETSFLLAKPNQGTPLFTGDIFQWARFCNVKEKVASSRGSGDGVAKKEVVGGFSPEL